VTANKKLLRGKPSPASKKAMKSLSEVFKKPEVPKLRLDEENQLEQDENELEIGSGSERQWQDQQESVDYGLTLRTEDASGDEDASSDEEAEGVSEDSKGEKCFNFFKFYVFD
jgi:hypothetical protein